MSRKIVLDLETQKAFGEVGGKQGITALGVSVVGVYDYETDKYRAYEEKEIPELEELLMEATEMIGFNHIGFDIPVLKPYLQNASLDHIKQTDIMVEIQKMIGHRVSLNKVAGGTLGTKKTGHGLDAITYYKNGEMDKLKKYCLDDVKLTKQVYDHGTKHGLLKYEGGWGTYEVPVNFR